MKILMINKFLHPNGGSETYMFELGRFFAENGHEVQYFGMEHEGRIVGNRLNEYTSDMDFHGKNSLSKITYPIKTIYSKEARQKLHRVLEDFKPDVCHINNFNYQLTPSILVEIESWRKKNKKDVKIIFTAHDFQLLCPNHMLRDVNKNENCNKCIGGNFSNCMKNKCIHGSMAKSVVGMLEAEFWKHKKAYEFIDSIVCPSEFMKKKMDTNPMFADKTIAMHNFMDADSIPEKSVSSDKPYVLYFGRFSKEKGIRTLLEAARILQDIPFVFAGSGPLEEEVKKLPNVTFKGFLSGEPLRKLIAEAAFSVYPSEWYENCPFSVMESQAYGTPVIGADIGGIPELILTSKDVAGSLKKPTGVLFESGNAKKLANTIKNLYNDTKMLDELREGCKVKRFDTTKEYADKLIKYCYSK